MDNTYTETSKRLDDIINHPRAVVIPDISLIPTPPFNADHLSEEMDIQPLKAAGKNLKELLERDRVSFSPPLYESYREALQNQKERIEADKNQDAFSEYKAGVSETKLPEPKDWSRRERDIFVGFVRLFQYAERKLKKKEGGNYEAAAFAAMSAVTNPREPHYFITRNRGEAAVIAETFKFLYSTEVDRNRTSSLSLAHILHRPKLAVVTTDDFNQGYEVSFDSNDRKIVGAGYKWQEYVDPKEQKEIAQTMIGVLTKQVIRKELEMRENLENRRLSTKKKEDEKSVDERIIESFFPKKTRFELFKEGKLHELAEHYLDIQDRFRDIKDEVKEVQRKLRALNEYVRELYDVSAVTYEVIAVAAATGNLQELKETHQNLLKVTRLLDTDYKEESLSWIIEDELEMIQAWEHEAAIPRGTTIIRLENQFVRSLETLNNPTYEELANHGLESVMFAHEKESRKGHIPPPKERVYKAPDSAGYNVYLDKEDKRIEGTSRRRVPRDDKTRADDERDEYTDERIERYRRARRTPRKLTDAKKPEPTEEHTGDLEDKVEATKQEQEKPKEVSKSELYTSRLRNIVKREENAELSNGYMVVRRWLVEAIGEIDASTLYKAAEAAGISEEIIPRGRGPKRARYDDDLFKKLEPHLNGNNHAESTAPNKGRTPDPQEPIADREPKKEEWTYTSLAEYLEQDMRDTLGMPRGVRAGDNIPLEILDEIFDIGEKGTRHLIRRAGAASQFKLRGRRDFIIYERAPMEEVIKVLEEEFPDIFKMLVQAAQQ